MALICPKAFSVNYTEMELSFSHTRNVIISPLLPIWHYNQEDHSLDNNNHEIPFINDLNVFKMY
jgi:hypothetical protein